jgi:hypothetical protein
MADGNGSSSVAIVAIVILVLAAGFFFFTNFAKTGGGNPTKVVNVDIAPKAPAAPGGGGQQ